jgi:hypothetical protein
MPQSVPSSQNQDINIHVDISLLANSLAANPAFIAAISQEVRNQMTKDVRWMGNLFAKWASTNPPAPSTRKRSQ